MIALPFDVEAAIVRALEAGPATSGGMLKALGMPRERSGALTSRLVQMARRGRIAVIGNLGQARGARLQVRCGDVLVRQQKSDSRVFALARTKMLPPLPDAGLERVKVRPSTSPDEIAGGAYRNATSRTIGNGLAGWGKGW